MSSDPEDPSHSTYEAVAQVAVALGGATRPSVVPSDVIGETFGQVVTEAFETPSDRDARARAAYLKLQKAGGFSESRAREAEACADVEEKVAFIVDTMSRLEWVRGRSGKFLALVWKCSPSTVENYSAEASRLVIGDAETARRDITSACAKALRSASDASDYNGIRQVGTLWASVSGALAPTQQKVEISGPATPAQAARLVREAFGDKVISEHDEPPPELPPLDPEQ